MALQFVFCTVDERFCVSLKVIESCAVDGSMNSTLHSKQTVVQQQFMDEKLVQAFAASTLEI